MLFPIAALLILLAGSWVYCVLVIVGARRYLRHTPPPLVRPVPISVLKTLHGLDEGLRENLRSYFLQDYPHFELVFGIDYPEDPAGDVVGELIAEYPQVTARLLVTGAPTYTNPKVYSLERLAAAATHELLVMADSDIRVTPDMLTTIAAEFQDQRLGLTTCPYRAVPGKSFWSLLEAIGMNTEFMSGILVARLVEGMNFAVGPTISMRKPIIAEIGGFARVKDSYIDDFLLGRYTHEAGYRVELSSYVIEHHIGTQGFAQNARHRVTWLRGTRRSRPSGYFGQVFTYPVPIALLLLAVAPSFWPLTVVTLIVRALAARATADWMLQDPLSRRCWYLVPLQDVASFLFYLAAYLGNTITWRGRRYLIKPGGDLELLRSR